jgi:hypothetical protein
LAAKPPGPVKEKPKGNKLSCYNCYKLFYLQDGQQPSTLKNGTLSEKQKQFCTDICQKKYQAKHSLKCNFPKCAKGFLKENGFSAHARWFCCQEHSEKDPQTMKLDELIDAHTKKAPIPTVLEEVEREMKEM